MNREQAEKELREAKQKIAEVEQYLKDNPEDVIMVPDNIHLCGGGQILFNNDTQILNCVTIEGYEIGAYEPGFDYEPHKLIPADKDNLETGQVYHFTDSKELADRDRLFQYGIWNGEGFICIEDGFPMLDTNHWNYIYKAVPVED